MFDHVVEPLLTDPKQGDPLGIGEIPIRQLPLQSGNDAAALQLQLPQQTAYRLLQGHVVELARAQSPEQAAHRVVDPERQGVDQGAALAYPGVIGGEPAHYARLGANGGDGLADVVVQLARHLLADALLGLQQPLGELAIVGELAGQRLIELTLALDPGAEQQAGEALGQQGEQQVEGMIMPGLARQQGDGVHQGGEQRPLPAVAPRHGDDGDGETKRREAHQRVGQPQLQPEAQYEQQQVPDQMAKTPVHRLIHQRRPQRHPGGAGEVVPDQHAGGGEGETAGQTEQQGREAILPRQMPEQGLQQRRRRDGGEQQQQLLPVVAYLLATGNEQRQQGEQAAGDQPRPVGQPHLLIEPVEQQPFAQ
ncbi:hypothetical protein D3C80_939510 [compost metagenome]